ncbi:hypothetical protein [Iamia sp.]|uniref:hypothetical protein n=1 Tax=Iamia sp. TaxID=2722710 RepID=UPI002CA6B2F7|nr:hypothetical protein [Iamia sp.]HXH57072.1 hypothetical protein [Iamia sp.]
MTTASSLGAIIDALDGAGIPHMLAGSFASSLHGLARTTADIDLVIDPAAGAVDRFVDRLDVDRFYVDRQAARRASDQRDQFNVIDTATGWKVDLIVKKDRPFSVTEFERRSPATVLGVPVLVATAEDTVLAKLEWSRGSDSDRQRRDVTEILRIRAAGLDEAYLDRWAADLDLTDLLATARRAASST